MGKVQILAVLTMDGCLSSELYDKAHQDLCLDRCGLDEIRKNALYRVTPDYSISMLHEWRKDCTNIRYLAEATPDTADYINGLLRMHAVDEIILDVYKRQINTYLIEQTVALHANLSNFIRYSAIHIF